VSALDFQLGAADETTYATAVTPARFFDTYRNPDGINAEWERLESQGMRPGQRTARSDRFAVYPKGASGDLEVEVLTKGFGFWLKHMLGAVATTAGAVGEVNTHTATMGDLQGKSFTAQIGRPFNPSGVVQPFTYPGGKVTSWELANSVEELLVCTLSCDFQTEETATALAVASYPSGANSLSWAGGAVTVGGTAFEASEISVSVNNSMDVDRRFLRSTALKREPIEGMREVEFSMTAAFDSLAQRNRVASATAAGALAEIVATWTGPVQEGATTTPLLRVRIPAGRFDGFSVSGGPDPMTQELTGRGVWNGTASPVTLEYLSLDATP
jgi:hypothetical protein